MSKTYQKGYKLLNAANLKAIYELFLNNEPFNQIPFTYFKKGTLKDDDFDPNLTLLLYNYEIKPIAALIAVNRKKFNPQVCFLKVFIVDKSYQRQGIGSLMLEELIKRIKLMTNSKISYLSYGDSVPEFWEPGVDLRHTSLYFFLKKSGFKTHKMRQNLKVELQKLSLQPKSLIGTYKIERIQSSDFNNAFKFAKVNFPMGTWAEEIEITFKNQPPTTFIAKNKKDEIIGWASHSQVFPGSFGPTGVLEPLRGQGIGSELLYWCLWDIKERGLDSCIIMWVEGDTIKFYSKTVGAYIYNIFIPMTKKIE